MSVETDVPVTKTDSLPALPVNRPLPLSIGGIAAVIPQTLDEAYRMARLVTSQNLAPKGLETPERCCIAILTGLEVGLKPMQAVQRIMIIGTKPTVWGDAMPGLCEASGRMEYLEERFEGEGDSRVAIAVTHRKGKPSPVERRFSVEDAKMAHLWGKAGAWRDQPDRMLQMRARSTLLRDVYPDVLMGLYTVEEARDIQDDESAQRAPVAPAQEAPRVKPATTKPLPSPVRTPPAPAPVEPEPAQDAQEAIIEAGKTPAEVLREVSGEPLVKAVLDAFPGAEVVKVTEGESVVYRQPGEAGIDKGMKPDEIDDAFDQQGEIDDFVTEFQRSIQTCGSLGQIRSVIDAAEHKILPLPEPVREKLRQFAEARGERVVQNRLTALKAEGMVASKGGNDRLGVWYKGLTTEDKKLLSEGVGLELKESLKARAAKATI